MTKKGIKQRLMDLDVAIPKAKELAREKCRELSKLENEYKSLIAFLESPAFIDPIVSEHAVVRYLERHYNIDIDKIRDEILTDSVKSYIKAGAKAINVNGMSFKVEDNVITTVI